jgi:hypothetical protein
MDKPLVVHTREADEDTWDIMRTHLPENQRVLYWKMGQARGLYSPIRSYGYTVAMFPLPYKNVLRYRMRQNVGGISILVFNTKMYQRVPPTFCRVRCTKLGIVSLAHMNDGTGWPFDITI